MAKKATGNRPQAAEKSRIADRFACSL